jgi:hypothetical protein
MQQALTDAANHLQAAGQILNLFVDESIIDDVAFSVVKTKAFAILDPASFPLVSNYMRNIKFDKTGFEWSAYSKLSNTFKRNLRQLSVKTPPASTSIPLTPYSLLTFPRLKTTTPTPPKIQ